MQLVEIRKNEVFCDSSMVARKFNLKHKDVVSNIKKLSSDLLKLRGDTVPPKTPTIEQRVYRGRNYTAYLMSRDFFSLLAMRFRGQKALYWQIQFNNAFYQMENQILLEASHRGDKGWFTIRFQGKIARLEETDAIKKFVEYATEQGSKNAHMYYKHITNATYKALDLLVQKKPKLRDTLDVMDIGMLASMEHYAQRLLLRYMELGREYHDIYNTVRDDLVEYGKIIKNPTLPE